MATRTIYLDTAKNDCWICGREPAVRTRRDQKDGVGMGCYVKFLKLGWRPKEESPDPYIAKLKAADAARREKRRTSRKEPRP
jgi:hypothetical protein